MKILFLTNHLENNDGFSRYSSDLMREIQNQGNEVLCITGKKSSQENEFNERLVLKSPLKYFNPATSFFTSLRVSGIIKDFSPDVIHFLVEQYASILPFLNTGRIKIFITIHGTYSFPPILLNNAFKKMVSRYLTSKMYERMDGIIAVSNYTRNHLLNYLPELDSKIKVITNGIDMKKIKVDNINRPQSTRKKILFVGAVKHRKGILESLKALEHYNRNFSKDFFYDIVGYYEKEDSYYKEIERTIIDNGLSDKVILRGRVTEDELDDFYKQAKLFLMLPKNNGKAFEGFGLVYLEANARGVPCIGAKGCGAEEAIEDGKTGYVVDARDYKEIARNIDLILNKITIRRDDCINWAKENSIEKKAEEIIKFYQAI